MGSEMCIRDRHAANGGLSQVSRIPSLSFLLSISAGKVFFSLWAGTGWGARGCAEEASSMTGPADDKRHFPLAQLKKILRLRTKCSVRSLWGRALPSMTQQRNLPLPPERQCSVVRFQSHINNTKTKKSSQGSTFFHFPKLDQNKTKNQYFFLENRLSEFEY